MDEQKQSKMCGRKGFAFARLMLFEFGGIRVSAPQEGAGGMRGGHFGILTGYGKRNIKMVK